MKRRGVTGFSLLALSLLPLSHPAAEEPRSVDDPRLGGPTGRLRYRIARGPDELVETPDVVTLKDGTQHEAYWLRAFGNRLVFYVKETETSWLREEVSRGDVAEVRFGEYLDRDPLETKPIEPARKQPVPKSDLLNGVFAATLGRNGSIAASFASEIDKAIPYAEDATDHGAFELESRMSQGDFRGAWSHCVRATGKYFLYAPNTIRNREWVLTLTQVVHSELDRTWDTSVETNFVPDETFILRFAPGKDEFRLEWSNQGNWTWAALTQVTFHRVLGEGPPGGRQGEWMRDDRGGRPRRIEPARPSRSAPVLASQEEPLGFPRQPSLATARHAPSYWGIRDWKRPAFRLDGE
jgi:hypothetical protein